LNKKRFLRAFLALSVVFSTALTGCSSSQEAKVTFKETTSTTPREGGTLVIARVNDANNLDPHFLTILVSQSVIHHKVYEGLVKMGENGDFEPMLATEWKQLNDVTWEFKLREGVTFHDGAPFNAEAVQKTIARVLDKKVASPRANLFEMIKEVKAVDDHRVQFILHAPFAPLLSVLASGEGAIISPKAIEQYGLELSKHPTGTGPFTFQSWTPGQEIVLVKNENYWGKKPKIDKVVFKAVPEDATRIAMVETGEAHVAEQLPVTEIERVQSSSTMNVGRFEAFYVDFIAFNTKKKPFDDVRVRRAIAYAVDTESILKGVYNNVGKKTNSTMGPKVIGYSPNVKGYEYDLNKAKKLLAEAGYPNGFTATITTNDIKARINVAEVLQSQLKGIGIDLKVNVVESGAFVQAAIKGDTEMHIRGWGNATGDGDYNQYNLYHSASVGAAGNYSFYTNAEVDKLIEAARKEQDLEKRKEYYEKAQEIERRDVVDIPLRSVENIVAMSKNVKGVFISPSGLIQFYDASIQ